MPFINALKQVQKQGRMSKKYFHAQVKSCFSRQRKKIAILILETATEMEKLRLKKKINLKIINNQDKN
jgi:hypothetical protein